MNEDSTRDLPELSFQQRVLAEFAALRGEIFEFRGEVGALRGELVEIHRNVAEIRTQQTSMAKNIAGLDQRLTSLEATVDARLRETRPIWETVRAQIERLDAKFDSVIRDLYDVRADVGLHDKRLGQIERRVMT